MINIDTVKEVLKDFHTKFKRPVIDDLPALFRFSSISDENWASLWAEGGLLRKYADAPCVYFFFDEEKGLLYIGKAEVLGKRMFQHFDTNSAKWKGIAKGIGLLPIPKECWFEILAIEAYLINKLNPPKNSIGKNLIA